MRGRSRWEKDLRRERVRLRGLARRPSAIRGDESERRRQSDRAASRRGILLPRRRAEGRRSGGRRRRWLRPMPGGARALSAIGRKSGMTWSFPGRWSLVDSEPLTTHPLLIGCSRKGPRQQSLAYSVPLEGITTIFSTVAFSGNRSASTTVRATVSADIILRLGAFGHSVFQISVSVAPGMRAITRLPFGLNSSRNVLVNPRAPCFDAL